MIAKDLLFMLIPTKENGCGTVEGGWSLLFCTEKNLQLVGIEADMALR